MLDMAIEMTYDIMVVDQVTRSAGWATKVASWVRISSIGQNKLNFGTHTWYSNRNDIRY
jgi:hypothetical protein